MHWKLVLTGLCVMTTRNVAVAIYNASASSNFQIQIQIPSREFILPLQLHFIFCNREHRLAKNNDAMIYHKLPHFGRRTAKLLSMLLRVHVSAQHR
ncbi:hypothetical protein J3E68DRAFT_418996 [Trichoderma sp. SZMC 28012]